MEWHRVKTVCGLAFIAAVLGFFVMAVFGDRAYCWEHPHAEPNMRNGAEWCSVVGGTLVDAVLTWTGFALFLGGVLTIIGTLVWAFRPSARG
ncbi:hypothetical protein AB0K02_24390 [Streptomyces sp. NPDC049597]|uniref:hypothetical protein n=1 Tax=Streptomyces sp. NPDC049597 TaxID=3155276 RepID=UPI003448A30B